VIHALGIICMVAGVLIPAAVSIHHIIKGK
jgi:hypothetical protein